MSAPPSAAPSAFERLAASLQARRGVLASLAVLAGLGLASRGVWSVMQPRVAADPRYVVTQQTVATSPVPAWLRRDVTAEVFAENSLDGALSVLAPPGALESRVAAAYASHPWVRRVGAISKTPPNRLAVELEYRTPLAAVEGGPSLLTVDRDGVPLVAADLPAEWVRHLPRVELPNPATAPPRAGAAWNEPRLAGALAIVSGMGPAWNELHLYRVRAQAIGVGGGRYWSYELVSTGNTVVVWGAAPGFEPPGEKPAAEKLASLRQAVAQHGPLDSVATSPAMIDVRERGVAYPRVVMKDAPRLAAEDAADEIK